MDVPSGKRGSERLLDLDPVLGTPKLGAAPLPWIHPIILGSEGPKSPHFFSWPQTRFRLVSTKTLPNGIAILTYELEGLA